MNTQNKVVLAVLFLGVMALLITAPIAKASEETTKKYLTAEEYVELARPYLHLSCESAWEQASAEADAYIKIVDTVSAISFLNHDLDINEVYERPEEDVEALRVEYYNEVGRLCRENPHYLLAGVVERALLNAFSKIVPEAVED